MPAVSRLVAAALSTFVLTRQTSRFVPSPLFEP